MKSSERRAEQERAEATLATIDGALEAGRVAGGDADERQLGQLALTLRAGAPQPSASFAAELERRVETGFAAEESRGGAGGRGQERDRERRGRRTGFSGRRALGALAAALVALVLGAGVLASVGGLGAGGGYGAGGGGVAPSVAPREGESGAGSSSDDSPPVAPGAQEGFAPGEDERRIERTASLTLAAPEQRMDAVSNGVVAVTDRHRGFIVSSSTFSGEEEEAGGSFELRVPADELRATLSDLAALGTVRAQKETGEDLTQPVASAADRLDGARAERRGLLRRLEGADTDREARALRRQLRLVSGEIRGLRGELEGLEERTDYASVSMTLVDESSSGAAGAPNSTASALEDALGSLVVAFNLALRAMGVLIPLALVGAVGWLGSTALRRRRREGVLG